MCVCACVCVLHCERGGYCIAFDGGLLQTTSCTIQNTGLHLAVIAAKTTLKGGSVTSAGWQVTLCDPMWHVSSRSSVATLRTAIHLLLTYLLYTCSCKEGYEGAYCQVSAVSASELPLLISLSTLLPVAAILVVITTIIFIYRRLNASRSVTITQTQLADTRRSKYVMYLNQCCDREAKVWKFDCTRSHLTKSYVGDKCTCGWINLFI